MWICKYGLQKLEASLMERPTSHSKIRTIVGNRKGYRGRSSPFWALLYAQRLRLKRGSLESEALYSEIFLVRMLADSIEEQRSSPRPGGLTAYAGQGFQPHEI